MFLNHLDNIPLNKIFLVQGKKQSHHLSVEKLFRWKIRNTRAEEEKKVISGKETYSLNLILSGDEFL